MTDPIVKTIDLPCTAAHAFDVFVHQMNRWWPLDSHSVSVDRPGPQAASHGPSVAVEAFVGGRVVETRADGGASVWGEVLAYRPPHHFAMTWHPGTDPDRPTRVDLAFDALAQGGTRVTLTHSGWEVWAADAPDKRGNYDSGWELVFCQRYRATAQA